MFRSLLLRLVHNFRMGLATNSSSSHSLVFFKTPRPNHDATWHDVTDVEFGWDQFQLTTLREKLMYALVGHLQKAGLAHAWQETADAESDDLLEFYVNNQSLFPEFTKDDFVAAAKGYIDHQSMDDFGDGSRVLEAARNPFVEIWGGNDNGGNPHADYLGWYALEGATLPGDMEQVEWL